MRHILFFAISIITISCNANAREQIRTVGSSTVYPFVTVAAEQFGQGGKFRTPIVESTGTGGGFKLFCEGLGDKTPDIANASRPITDSEKELCKKNGVTDIAEISIGYDGIVLATKKGTQLVDISRKTIFLALARELPDANGKLQKNHYQTWNEIDPALPKTEIAVYGPPPTSGTRDAFVELVMEKGSEQVAGFAKAYPDEKLRKKSSHLLREDGKYVDSGEDDNIIVQKLFSNETAFGILGYSFVEENTGKVQSSKIEGVLPSFETIENGKYSVSRSLYMYVKKQHIGKVAGIAEFLKEMTSENAIGAEGYVTERGLLPLNEVEQKKMREAVKKL